MIDNVYCRGTEKSIGQCRHRGWHRSNCDHYEDVGVKCHVPQLQGHKVRMLQPKVVRTGFLVYDFIFNPICSFQPRKLYKNYSFFYNFSKCALHFYFEAYLSVDKHSRNSPNLKFSVKSLNFSGFDICSKPNFAQKLLRKAKGCSRLL